MAEKLQLALFKFRTEYTEIKKARKPVTYPITLDFILKALKGKQFRFQNLKQNLSPDYNIQLYFKKSAPLIKWKSFIEAITEADEPIIKNWYSHHESFILIFESKQTGVIYATTGGYGHTGLQDYIDNDFGLDILSRILKADDKALRSTKERSLIGGILGEIKYFRNDYNLNENDNFGSFYQELHANLDKKILQEIFDLSDDDVKRGCLCVAKNSFTIKKSISFEQILNMIAKCEDLLQNVQPIAEINSVKKLKKSDQVLKETLNQTLNGKVWNIITTNGNSEDIELCHEEFEKYFGAVSFKVSYAIKLKSDYIEYDEPIRYLSQITTELKAKHNLTDQNLMKLIENVYVESLDDTGMSQTKDNLKKHFYTELTENGKSYFLTNNDWYEITQSFVTKLNEQCQSFITLNKFAGILKPWDYPSNNENSFNSSHMVDGSTLVLDKITYENIESCDILKWDDEFVYFIHAKAGFDNSMRDLTHQVFISAKRIKEDSKMGHDFLKALYNKLLNMDAHEPYFINAKAQLNSISENDFLQIFKTRQHVFVLAVLDTAVSIRSLDNLEEFDSNIAKFSLASLHRNMKDIDTKFQIVQISKP